MSRNDIILRNLSKAVTMLAEAREKRFQGNLIYDVIREAELIVAESKELVKDEAFWAQTREINAEMNSGKGPLGLTLV